MFLEERGSTLREQEVAFLEQQSETLYMDLLSAPATSGVLSGQAKKFQ